MTTNSFSPKVLLSDRLLQQNPQISSWFPEGWVLARLDRSEVAVENKPPVLAVIADARDDETLHEINWELVAKRQSALFVTLSAGAAEVGPLSVPGRSACWECRVVGRRRSKEPTFAESNNPGDGQLDRMFFNRVIQSVDLAVRNFRNDVLSDALVGAVLQVDANDYVATLHSVYESPACNACRSTWLEDVFR